MNRAPAAIVLGALLLVAPAARAAGDLTSLSNTNPLTSLSDNVLAGFSGLNLGLQFSAAAVTPAIVSSGPDTEFHNFIAR